MSFISKLLYPFLNYKVGTLSKKSLRAISPELTCPQLCEGVDAYYDKWGVPHIYAENELDLFFAQGFVTAADRLWQMELSRRLAAGTLAEIFGPAALDTDRLTRTIGMRRLGEKDWAKMDASLKERILAYCNGINECITHYGKNLPAEFKLAKFQPGQWSGEDVMGIARLIKWQMSHAWYHELVRARLVEKVGYERAMELEINYPEGNPVAMPEGIEFNKLLDDGRLQASAGPFLKPGGGSNAWAISGSRTKSGKPLLCNDPHLQLTLPGIWYENHLSCDSLEVSGVSIPGIPMVMIGHNKEIAWGITLAYTDCEDIFIEKFTDSGLSHYQFGDQILPSQKILEKINVKGREKPHVEEVVITHHGPVISSITGYEKEKICLNSMSLRESEITLGAYKLNKAENWDEFVGALSHFNAPQLNIVYADRSGNIGYWVTGEVPVREKGNGTLPAAGWTGDQEWTGIVPFMEMPHQYNPSSGYVLSCNHKIVDKNFPHFLGNTWMNGYRAKRLKALIEGKSSLTIEEMKDFQLDIKSLASQELIALLNKVAPRGQLAQELLILLNSWDSLLRVDSHLAWLFERFKSELMKALYHPLQDKELQRQLGGGGLHPVIVSFNEFYGQDTNILIHFLNNPGSWWVDQAGGVNSWINNAASVVIEERSKLLKKAEPLWGDVHKLEFKHAMSEVKPLDKIFNIGPFGLGGDADTPAQSGFPGLDNYSDGLVCASYRQIIDLSDWSKCLSVMPPGQSGQLSSPHYDDQAKMWADGNYKPMLWYKEDVLSASVRKLALLKSRMF